MARHGVRRDDKVMFFFLLFCKFSVQGGTSSSSSAGEWSSGRVAVSNVVFICSKFGVTAGGFLTNVRIGDIAA